MSWFKRKEKEESKILNSKCFTPEEVREALISYYKLPEIGWNCIRVDPTIPGRFILTLFKKED